MAVLVPVLEALSVDVWMGVNVVAVAVLVFVVDTIVVDYVPGPVAVATRSTLWASPTRWRCAAR